jgi:putative addiction module component (TIGR02574 family)
MAARTLDELLKLPASDRADIAFALWESLTDTERDAEFILSNAQRDELDRRWAKYLAHPESSVPWQEVKQRLRNRR